MLVMKKQKQLETIHKQNLLDSAKIHWTCCKNSNMDVAGIKEKRSKTVK